MINRKSSFARNLERNSADNENEEYVEHQDQSCKNTEEKVDKNSDSAKEQNDVIAKRDKEENKGEMNLIEEGIMIENKFDKISDDSTTKEQNDVNAKREEKEKEGDLNPMRDDNEKENEGDFQWLMRTIFQAETKQACTTLTPDMQGNIYQTDVITCNHSRK